MNDNNCITKLKNKIKRLEAEIKELKGGTKNKKQCIQVNDYENTNT